MDQPSPAIVKKLRTLAKMAAELRQGGHFEITRLTILKSFCADVNAAAKFALYIAKLAQRRFKAHGRGRMTPTKRKEYEQLIGAAIGAMSRYLKSPGEETKSKLWDVYDRAKRAQNRVKHQRWGAVRIIECWELLIVETAMDCVQTPLERYTSILGYQLARQYAEKYNPHFATGLVPESAPMVEEIAAFWGKHYLGRGWRKKVGA